MKHFELLKRKEQIEKDIKELDIASSKIIRDEGFLPFSMRANKRKMLDRLKKVEDDLSNFIDKQSTTKKTTTKKKTSKEDNNEEVRIKTNNSGSY